MNWQHIYNAGNGVWDSELKCFVKINHPRKLKALLTLWEQAQKEEVDLGYELAELCKRYRVTSDVYSCPVCQGTEFKNTYENSGFTEPDGPCAPQIISSVCVNCSYDLCK